MIFLHEGAITELAGVFERANYGRVLFVLDDGAYAACGAEPIVESVLKDRVVSRFVGFELNPKLADLERGLEMSRDLKPDVVVALGGGTAIDLGKLIGSLSAQSGNAAEMITGQQEIERQGLPLIAIPTTAGTGSEATHFAVAYVDGEKFSVAHESLLPDVSIVDPRLTYSLPAGITAATGLDALCQAIESTWAVGATDESLVFAAEATRLAIDNLVCAVNEPTPAARMAMCRASHLAGRAINISKTTAPHALSYAMTSRHGIPHGIAVAMTLGPMLVFNSAVTSSDCIDPRGDEDVRLRVNGIVEMLGAGSAGAACLRFQDILSSINCPRSMTGAGITSPEDVQKIVSSVNIERLSNNPRRADHEALLQVITDVA